jgi:hypothetical protein
MIYNSVSMSKEVEVKLIVKILLLFSEKGTKKESNSVNITDNKS